MNAGVTKQHAGPFLPDIFSNRKKRWKSDQLRTMASPQDQPDRILSKAETSQFRNSRKQNMCVEMLQEGFHRSFSELFSLLGRDHERREAAEPGSALSLQIPLEEQRDKVETMRQHLCQAEQAEWTGSWSVVCEQRLSLAHFFSAPEDLWLQLHFYHSCMDRECGRFSRPATEARACLAELFLQQGDVDQAKHQAELCLQQAEEGGWLDSDGYPLRLQARKTLCRIYSRLADPLLDSNALNEALTLLHKGHSLATESEDKHLEAEASYRLGLTYQKAGDHNTAKQFFNTCMQMYSTLEDAEGLGESYKAMATSLESEGNVDEAVQCLEKLVDIYSSSGLQKKQVDIFLDLGNIYSKKSEYMRACEFFLQGYEVACAVGDVARLEKAQVMVACARARTLIRKFNADVSSSSPAALQRLLTWKDRRGHPELSTNTAENTDTQDTEAADERCFYFEGAMTHMD